MMIDRSKSIAEFIGRDWLEADRVREIVSETEVLIKKRKDHAPMHHNINNITNILNEIINFSILSQISASRPKPEWIKLSKLASHFLTYAENIESFRQDGLPVHSIPESLIKDAEYLISEVRGAFYDRRKPKYLPWERIFYPRMMAAFNAIFQAEPVSTASDEYEMGLGSTATFIYLTIIETHCLQRHKKFDERFRKENMPKMTWQVPSTDKLRVSISEWKKRKRTDEKGRQSRMSQPLWKEYVAEYEKRLQVSEIKK